MKQIEEVMDGFGRQMGFEHFCLNSEGISCLEIEGMGTLFLEKSDDVFLLSLSREVPSFQRNVFMWALESCHYQEGHPFPVHAGLVSENLLVFSARVPAAELSVPMLDRLTDLLFQMQRNVDREEGP